MMKNKQGNSLPPIRLESGHTEDISCSLDAEGHCITCSDEALQVRVLDVDEENGLAQVTLDGINEEIDISLIESIAPGDMLLVHAGVAIARIDEANNA